MNIKLVSLQWAKVVSTPWPETGAQRVDMSQDGGLHRDISHVRYSVSSLYIYISPVAILIDNLHGIPGGISLKKLIVCGANCRLTEIFLGSVIITRFVISGTYTGTPFRLCSEIASSRFN